MIGGIAGISASSLFAQKSGVFKTFADFTNGEMEYSIDCMTEKHKIRLNEFLGKEFITVVHEGKHYNLKKNEIWGYQLCDDKIVRFQDNEHYQLDSKGILWIYKKQSFKGGSPKGVGAKTVSIYYFSRGGDNSILELTPINLKASFPDDHELQDAIDQQFKSIFSLTEFDEFHKQYKINYFLETKRSKLINNN